MATSDVWDSLKYFKRDSTIDNWGDPDAISETILYPLDALRDFLNTPIIVSSGTGGQHRAGSYHYVENGACAVDIVIPRYSGNTIDLILAVLRFGFTGVGYYPDWRYNGKVVGGFHLDQRPLGMEESGVPKFKGKRWMGVKDIHGVRQYIPLTYDNIRQLGGIDGDD
jgi:hypothetical protein